MTMQSFVSRFVRIFVNIDCWWQPPPPLPQQPSLSPFDAHKEMR
jgi:hypothetical protein